MSDKIHTRASPDAAPALSLRASFQPSSVNEDTRTVEVTWTTGAAVLRSSWDIGQYFEELSLDPRHVDLGRLNNGAPFLANHDGQRLASVIGVVESAKLGPSGGTATVRFAKAEDDAEADKIYRKIKDGIIQNISVGYRVHKFEKVEGGESKIPTYRAISWEPYEISAVPMGADDGAGFRSLIEGSTRGQPQTESNTMTPEEIAAAKAAEEKRAADALKTATEAAVAAERSRVAEINKSCRAVKLGDDFASELIAKGSTVDQARAAIIEKLAERDESTQIATQSPSVDVRVTDDNKDKFIRGVSAAMFERAGTSGLVEQAKKKGGKSFDKVDVDPGEFRGINFEAAARLCLERAGVSTRGMYDKAELFKRAFAQRAGYSGTSDFAVLLENVMYKQLRAAYDVQSDTWSRWCGTDEVQDFRDANRFDLGSFGTLDLKGENGEYKNKSIPDGAKKTIQTETRGNIIGVTREMLINDDMGAMANVATAFGRSAGRSIEVQAYELLNENSGLGPTYEGSNFFDDTAYANVSTGAALSVAALDADRQKMRKQMDLSSNDYLDLVPSILLINPSLEAAAKVLNSSAWDHTSTHNQKPNPVQGMFTDIVTSPRLGTGTKRYLFSASKEAFKVVFLAGQGRGPVMETQEGFRNDGIEWKARIDFKVCPFDPKAAIYNAGT